MKRIFFIFLLTVLFSTRCSDFLDVNQNPAVPTDAPADIRFRAMIDLTYQTKNAVQMLAARMCQCWNYTGANSAMDMLNVGNYTASYLWWYALYFYQGGNVADAIDDATAKEAWHVVGAIQAFNAYTWLMTTDWMGDIPLKDAFSGKLNPSYDNQKLIYEHVDKLCDEALANFKRVNNDEILPLSRAEYIYNGDVTKWIKFTYLVKARCALHLYPYKTGQYDLDKIISYCDHSFTSNDDDFRQNADGNSNISTFHSYWSDTRGNITSYRQSQRMIDMLSGTIFQKDDDTGTQVPVQDPRLPKMFYPTPVTSAGNGDYYGILPPQGIRYTIPSMYGKKWSSKEYKSEIATYAEVQFIKAEACFNKGDKLNAFTAFQNGIRAHMRTLDVTELEVNEYLASGALAANPAQLTLAQIMTQKNIALFLLAEETWTDMRRYDFNPEIFLGLALPSTVYPDMKNQWPRRFTYLLYSEYDYNREELRSVEAIDAANNVYYPFYYKRVWWNRPEETSDKEYKVTPIY